MVGTSLFRNEEENIKMTPGVVRCAVYTRKSSEEGLEQSFNSLDAQREACEAYILSQRHEGWTLIPTLYDDGGFSGGNIQRPALVKLLADIGAKRVDTVVVYKVDRLTRSLADFAKIVEQFDKQGVSFVSVTQQFNTTSSMGRLTLNVLLSFAQFEREVTGERIRDKIAASKKKGMWMGGVVPMGYDLYDRQLVVNEQEARTVKQIYQAYLQQGCVSQLQIYLNAKEVKSKERLSKTGKQTGGISFGRGALYLLLRNKVYLGQINHKGVPYPGLHPAIIDRELWNLVQVHLKENIQGERRTGGPKPSLLTGRLFDEQGHRFTPTHANKKGKRYRYYVARISGSKSGTKSVPADEIENLVRDQVHQLLASPQRLRDLFGEAFIRVLNEHGEFSSKHEQILGLPLRRVVVEKEKVILELDRRQLWRDLSGEVDSGLQDQVILIESTAKLIRCGGEVRFSLPPDQRRASQNGPSSLARAVARAHGWLDQIISGQITNQRALAKETGLDERYISQIIQLAFLAPDVVEAILEGRLNEHIALEHLVRNLPLNWHDQRLQTTH
jgi:site-specific DNA recombinase